MRRVVLLLAAFATAAALASACGGSSVSNSSDDGDSGATGGAGGSSGTGGTGGTPTNPDCMLPIEPGNCNAAFQRFAFDARERVCRPFLFGGCGANANNFPSLEDCATACLAPDELDLTACESGDECVVTSSGCCGGCEPVDFWSLVAVNAKHLDEFGTRTCEPGVVCGACPDYPGPPLRPWFGAACRNGHCVSYDARSAAGCSMDGDCHLRDGVGCCEGCGDVPAERLVAISSYEVLHSLACEVDTACLACAVTFPPGAAPACIDGLCAADLNLR